MENSSLKARIGLSLNKNAVAELKKEIEIQFKDINVNVGINSSGSNSQLKTMIADLKEAKTRIQELENSQSKQSKNNSNRIASEIQMKKQLSDWNTKLQKQQLTHPEAFSGKTENSKKVIEDTEKLSVAMKNYEKNATKANKAMVGMDFNKLSVDIKKASTNTFSFSNMIQEAGKKFLAWMSVTQVAMQVIQGIKLMVKNVSELDKSLIELQKVTNLSGSSLEDFTQKAFKASAQLGRTGKDFIDAASEFARSGYTLQESSRLASEAMMMMNVGDNINDVETATSSLISTLKAYGMEATEARKINDLFNEVSNNSAISFDRLVEGVKRTGAVYAQAGTSIEELSGLLTGADEVMQNIEKSSSGLIVISQRIRGMKEAGDEDSSGVAKLSKDLKEIAGIDLMDSENQLRDTYDILKDLSSVYGSLTKNQQQYLGEEIAGKRQINVLQSLLTNWTSVEDAVKNATNSMGSAQKENDRYMGSIEARVNAVSSAFMQFSSNTIDSDFVKITLRIVEGLIKVIDKIGGVNVSLGILLVLLNKFNRTPKIIMAIQGAFSGVATKLKELNIIGATTAEIMTALSPLALLIGLKGLVWALDENTVSLEEQKQKVTDLSDELQTLQTEYTELSKKENQTSSDAEKLSMIDKEISLKKQLLKIEKELAYSKQFEEGGGGISQAFNNFGEQAKTAFKFMGSMVSTMGDMEELERQSGEQNADLLDAMGRGDEAIQTRIDYIKDLTDKNTQLSQQSNKLKENEEGHVEEINNLNSAYNENLEYIGKHTQALLEEKQTLIDAREAGVGNADSINKMIDAIDGAIVSSNNMTDIKGQAILTTNELSNAEFDLASVNEGLTKSSELLAQAWSEQDSNGSLSIQTVMKMIEMGGEYINMLDMEAFAETGLYSLKAGSAEAMFEINKQEAISKIEAEKSKTQAVILGLQSEISAFEATQGLQQSSTLSTADTVEFMGSVANANITALGETANATVSAAKKASAEAVKVVDGMSYKKATASMQEALASMTQYDAQINMISSLTLPSYTGATQKAAKATNNAGRSMDSAKESTKALEAEIDKLKDTIDGFKDKLGDAKDKLAETKEAYELFQKAIESQLEKEINALEKKLDLIEETKKEYELFQQAVESQLEKEINALEKKLELIDETKEEYEMMQKLAQEQLQKEMDEIQKKMDALDEEKEKEDDILRLQEAQLNVKKAQDALENAKQNKDTRVYSEGRQNCPKFTISVKG